MIRYLWKQKKNILIKSGHLFQKIIYLIEKGNHVEKDGRIILGPALNTVLGKKKKNGFFFYLLTILEKDGNIFHKFYNTDQKTIQKINLIPKFIKDYKSSKINTLNFKIKK